MLNMDDEIRKEDVEKTGAEVTENELETVSGGSYLGQYSLTKEEVGRSLNIKPKDDERFKLSGLRINSAADDAAGYAIVEKMRQQIRSLGNHKDDDN